MNKKEEVRNKNIVIRVTDNEKNGIEKKANRTGLAVSEYGRQIMLNGYVFQSLKNNPAEEEPGTNLDRRTLLGLANNLNQLTKYAHQTKILPKLEELLEKIEKIIEK
jgi:hypothetical protein